jgi:FtsH-binding integral membrane protein
VGRFEGAFWITAAGCLVLGSALALDDVFHSGWSRHFGYYLVAASFVAGLVFGKRGCALPVVGTVAFGITLYLQATVDPSGEDQRDLIIFAFIFVAPLVFGAVAAIGAVARYAVLDIAPGLARKKDTS